MRIVVTGAAGYIGSKLCNKLSEMGQGVVAFDNLWYDQGTLVSKVFCDNKVSFYKENILDWSENLVNHIKSADVIIPLAALVGAPLCDKHEQLATDLNYGWFEELQKHLNNQYVIYPNTNSGYGSTGEEICTEETPSNPLSLYAKTKQDSENLLMNYERSICFRLATVFGWSYRPRMDLLVNNLTYVAKTEGHLTVFDGHFRRNYIHVDDIVEAFIFSIKNLGRICGDVYNLGNDNLNTTKQNLVDKVCEITGATSSVDATRSDPDKRDYLVSSEKLYNLGYQPYRSLEYGIRQMLNFYDLLSESDKEKCKNY
jgi:nucleoside-diphosphate-sugar epimerase|tara:strand:+ start:16644 stop:17582 length:939 start_codon:yes stop_codon:yes gene_type:complete